MEAGSYSNVAAVTPSDTVDLPVQARALLLGSASTNLKVTTAGGQSVDLGVCAAGVIPLVVTRVWNTPTPPANIKALW